MRCPLNMLCISYQLYFNLNLKSPQVAPPNTNIMMYNNKLYCLHEASLPMECRMRPDGRLEYIGYETFDGVLDYPVSAHPVKDGDDLLFHSYSVDEKVSTSDLIR